MSSTNTIASYLLNFFAKKKDLNENIVVRKNQTLYDDALDVREIYELRSYVDLEIAHNNNVYTISSTYHDDIETLKLYTFHSTSFINLNRDYEFRII